MLQSDRAFRFPCLGVLVASLLVVASASEAQNLLSLEANPSSIGVGDQVEVVVTMDFSDTTTGGGVTFGYDPAHLSLDSIAFDAGLGDDPDFECPGSAAVSCPGDSSYLSFGTVTGLTGQHTVATVTFTALSEGTEAISLSASSAFGGVGGDALEVTLNGTSVSVATAIPSLSIWGFTLLVGLLLGTAVNLVGGSKSRWRTVALALLFASTLLAPGAEAQAADTDLDGIDDLVDNCVDIANADQRDSDGDGYGSVCDGDFDNDLDVDVSDLDLMKSAFYGTDADADMDGNGSVDFQDLGLMAAQYGGVPGPKCSFCPVVPGSGSFESGQVLIAIPDGTGVAAFDSIVVAQNATILELDVVVQISHSYVGDLKVTLTHVETGTSVTLIDRPGVPASSFGCSGDDIDATLGDDATLLAENVCASTTPAIGGFLLPAETLDAFDGEDIVGTWTLRVFDLSSSDQGTLDSWSLELNDPELEPGVGLTAYRPQTESYGNPLVRRAISNALEENPGAGIRINGDDDDGDSTADRDDTTVAGENDLIEVELAVNQVTPPVGFEYVLRRSNSNIKVWDSQTKGTALLDTSDEVVVSPTGLIQSVWVENSDGGSASLEFEVRGISGGSVLSSDLIEFYPFTSLVIGLHGELQFPTDDPVYGPNEGISYIAIDLHEDGYDSHMYVENDVASDGSGAVYDEIVNAVTNRGITTVALYGFSHGGGSIYDLCERLDDNAGSIGPFDIPFTGYIDGIENDSDVDLDAETRLPIGSAYHVNYYQSHWSWWIWGDSVPGADVDVNVTSTGWGGGLSHISITTHANVQAGIHDPLVLRVDR